MAKAKSKEVTVNPAEAEAGLSVYFSWQGLDFIVDPGEIQFGRWAYATRRVSNEKLLLVDRVNAAIDIFEAVMGEDQVATLAAACPNLFDDGGLLDSFWDAFIKATQGVSPGESSAS